MMLREEPYLTVTKAILSIDIIMIEVSEPLYYIV